MNTLMRAGFLVPPFANRHTYPPTAQQKPIGSRFLGKHAFNQHQ